MRRMHFNYDPSGEKVAMTIMYNQTIHTIWDFYYWYVRDAQGNVMATYQTGGNNINTSPLILNQHVIYGSSRLGQVTRNQDMDQARNGETSANYNHLGTGILFTFTRGNKLFETANHLGSVNMTQTDRHAPVNSGGNVTFYRQDMQSAEDFTPFGMSMPGKVFDAGAAYSYKFNGKERMYEINGKSNQYDYGMRIYDPRGGRFWSMDPLTKSFPWNSPYSYAENSPILFKDLDGLEKVHYQKTVNDGKTQLKYTNTTDYYVWTWNPHWGGTKLGFTLYDLVKNPSLKYVTHEATDGTWEQNDKVQFIVYDQTETFDNYTDMIARRNGTSGHEKGLHYLSKGLQAGKEESRLNGGAGMYVNLFGKANKAAANVMSEWVRTTEAGFEVTSRAGVIGETFKKEVFVLVKGEGASLNNFLSGIEKQAMDAGAKSVEITGLEARSGFFSSKVQKMLGDLGYKFAKTSDETFTLTKSLNAK